MIGMYDKVLTSLEEGKSVVLVSIIRSIGSVPRGAGAQMIVLEDSTSIGTIGGGKIEFRSIQDAAIYFKEKRNHIEKFRLDPHSEGNLGMVCGGNVDVLFHYIEASTHSIELMKYICDKAKEHVNSWIVTKIDEDLQVSLEVVTEKQSYEIKLTMSNHCELMEEGSTLYYVEPLRIISKTYIFGGGHVAQATIPLLQMLQFDCVVVEDRKELLDSLSFDQPITKLYKKFDSLDDIEITANDFVLALSRGHSTDLQAVQAMLAKKPKYIGMMGSKAKVAMVLKELKTSGYSDEEIAELHSPIGLDIGASNPTEIGLSIVAQMTAVRNGK